MRVKTFLSIFAILLIISFCAIPALASDGDRGDLRDSVSLRGAETYNSAWGNWLNSINDDPTYYYNMKSNDTWDFVTVIYINGLDKYVAAYSNSSSSNNYSRGTVSSFNSSTGQYYMTGGSDQLYFIYNTTDSSIYWTGSDLADALFVQTTSPRSTRFESHNQGFVLTSSNDQTAEIIYTSRYSSSVNTLVDLLSECNYFLRNFTPTPAESYSIQYFIGNDLVNQLENQTSIPIFNPPQGLIPAGYAFAGWFYDVDFQNPAIVGTSISSDVVLYGKIEKAAYTIIFDSNGGSAVENFYGDTLPSPLAVPTRSGYGFAGWYFDNDTFLNQASGGQKLILTPGTNTVTLYARWLSTAPGTDPNGSGKSAYDAYIDSNSVDTAFKQGFSSLASLVFSAFLTLTSQIGFGGISVLTVLSTGIIIVISIVIFKIVRGA